MMVQMTSLPAELCFIIFKHAATPSFAVVESTNPYSSALTLCLVSKTVRLIVIPELLHTIFLPSSEHVMAFTDALYMQRAYAQEESHLHVDYAARVHSIWIEKIGLGGSRSAHRDYRINNFNFSLLAPVVLASKSLRVDYEFMFLLDGCLEHAWKVGIHSNTDHKSSPVPWSVETLTMCHPNGDFASYQHDSFTTQYSFFDFFFAILVTQGLSRAKTVGRKNTHHHKAPECPYDSNIPWSCLENLRFVSFGLPHQHYFYTGEGTEFVQCDRDLRVELFTPYHCTKCWNRNLCRVGCERFSQTDHMTIRVSQHA